VSGRRGLVFTPATLFLAGLALRPQIVGVGPLVPRIQSGLDVSHTVAGLLATIPVLCMGVFAPLAPPLLRRFGSRAAVGGSLVGAAAFGFARAVMPDAALVLLLTVPIGLGIAVAGTLLPAIVKGELAARPTLGTGLYTTGINVGATVAAVVAVPLAVLWSWRLPLVVFSAATLLVAALWLRRSHATPRAERAPLPVRNPVAWLLVAIFALQSSMFYGFNAWLSDTYVERGWSQGAGGGLVAAMNGAALLVGALTAFAADRRGSRRAYVGSAAAAAAAAAALVAADVAGAWAWALVLGAAMGVLFTIVMTLPLDVANGPAEVAAATTLMLGVGYVISALAPTALGALRDATGTFAAPVAVLAGVGAALAALAPLLQTRSSPT